MTLSLAANQYPAGTRPGSPIQVVDVQTYKGVTEYTAGLPMSAKAQGGDLVWVQWCWGSNNTDTYSTSLTTSPSGFFTIASGNLATDPPGPSEVIYTPLYRVLSGTPGQISPDAGRTIGLSWASSLNQTAWAMIVWTLRYVDSAVIFDVLFSGNPCVYATSGTSPSLNGVTNSLATSANGAGVLVLGAIAAEAGPSPGIGMTAVPLNSQWYNEASAADNLPDLALIAGYADLPVASQTYLGVTACAFNQPTATTANWVGSLAAFRPVPAPGVALAANPLFSLSAAGTNIDAAGISTIPFGANWLWAPTRGQGVQQSFAFARQVHGSLANPGFWNGDNNTWTNGNIEYWNLGDPDEYNFMGAFENDGTTWDLYGAITESALGLKSGNASLTLIGTFTAITAPAVTAVTITNQGTTTPTINWTETLTAGPQAAYRAKVFSAAQQALPGFSVANLLTSQDYDFSLAGNVGSWTGVNLGGGAMTIAQDTAHPFIGPGNLKLTFGAASGNVYSGRYPITPGETYTASVYCFADTVARPVQIGLKFYDSVGNFLIEVDGTTITDSTSSWVQATVTVPVTALTDPQIVNAATAVLVLNYPSAATSEVHRIDALELMATPAPVYDSGIVLSTALNVTTSALAASTEYTAYVSVWQQGDQQSPWQPLVYTNGTVNSPSASWFSALTGAPVPAPAGLVATVGGTF